MKIIKTGSDFLIDLINEKGKISILDASKELKVSKDIITSWAEVLSSKGRIGMYYPLTGEGILTKDMKTLGGKGPVEVEKERKTSEDLVFLMKDYPFLRFDRAVKKLNVSPSSLKKWVDKLEKEDVVETETYFFGDVGILKSDNFQSKLDEIKEKIKKGVERRRSKE